MSPATDRDRLVRPGGAIDAAGTGAWRRRPGREFHSALLPRYKRLTGSESVLIAGAYPGPG